MHSFGSQKSMNIAVIAPPWFTVPPHGYGGVENVCADLVHGLTDRGHAVTLIGAGASGTPARFVATYDVPPSARLGEPLPEVLHAAAAARVLDDLNVDIVHDHTLAGPLMARGRDIPTVVTMHGPSLARLASTTANSGERRLISSPSRLRNAVPHLTCPGSEPCTTRSTSTTYPFRDRQGRRAAVPRAVAPGQGRRTWPSTPLGRPACPIVVAGKCTSRPSWSTSETHIEPRLGPDVTIFGQVDADREARAAGPVCGPALPDPSGTSRSAW